MFWVGFNEWFYFAMIKHPDTQLFGILFLIVFLIAQLPYVISDVRDRQCRRACLASIGLRHLNVPDYKGFASAPEMELFTDVFARVPIVLIVGTAAAAGLDEAIMGEQENPVGLGICAVLVFFTGGSASSSTYRCVVEGTLARADQGMVGTIVDSVGGAIDNCVARFASLVFHGIDAMALTVVVSGIAIVVSHVQLTMWLLSLWLVCGVIPTLLAPPPMPTIKPSIPARGWKWWLHRSVVSVIMCAFPPTEYMPLLNRKKQLIWCFFAFVRTIAVVITTFTFPPAPIKVSGFDCAMQELVNSYIATTGTPCPIEDTVYSTGYIVYIGALTTLLMAVKRLDGTSSKVDEERARGYQSNLRVRTSGATAPRAGLRPLDRSNTPEVGGYMVML